MFSLNGTLKESGLVGRWETKQFIGMALSQYIGVLINCDIRGTHSEVFLLLKT